MSKKTKSERREIKKTKQKKMKVSGKSVFKLKKLIQKAK